MAAESRTKRVLLLVPVYNDWAVVSELAKKIGALKPQSWAKLSLLVLDDGSSQPMEAAQLKKQPGSCLTGCSLMRLERNLGHQGAIAVGLSHLAQEGGAYDAVL